MSRAKGRAASRGFTYLGVMYIVVLLGLTSAVASAVWSTVQRRDNERELIFVGRQFQAAIERYRQADQGPAARYPRQLDDLTEDRRSGRALHHLRQIYPDPITGLPQWGLVRSADGGIVGVYSLSEQKPIRVKSTLAGWAFPSAKTYLDWKFIARSATKPLTVKPATKAVGNAPNNPEAPPQESPEEFSELELQPPPDSDYEIRSPEACNRILAHDEALCQRQTVEFGEGAGRDCQESALARNQTCSRQDRSLLQPLVLGLK